MEEELIDKEINSATVFDNYEFRKWAAKDADRRSKIAAHNHKDFFDEPDHIEKVEKTKAIVKKFFNGAKLYINQRGLGRSKPFTVVKVERPLFPNHLTKAQKQNQFYEPLKDLGVEIVFAKGTDSYLFRVK